MASHFIKFSPAGRTPLGWRGLLWGVSRRLSFSFLTRRSWEAGSLLFGRSRNPFPGSLLCMVGWTMNARTYVSPPPSGEDDAPRRIVGPVESRTTLNAGSCMIPHPHKAATGGEDACFISSDGLVLAVADGVGGWANEGIDAGVYSRKLMAESEKALEEGRRTSSLQILNRAYDGMGDVVGSTTVCVLQVIDGKLDASNLGDSGFIIIRDGSCVYRTKEQQHRFNMPFQLGTGSGDAPKDSNQIQIDLNVGDIIVMGTDGLFDNLFDREIVELVNEGGDPEHMARRLANHAHILASDEGRESPFSKAACNEGYFFRGGKMDDISVIVAIVEPSSSGDDGDDESSSSSGNRPDPSAKL